MDRTLTKICGLLQGPDNMRRCAAAITLAELAPRDAGVVEALGEALQEANQTLTPYVLDALEAIGSRAAVPYLLPLLDAEDVTIKVRAIAAIAKAGAAALPEIKRMIAGATPRQKTVLADLLARIHTRDAFQILLDQLLDRDGELVKDTCEAIHRHVRQAGPQQLAAFHKLAIEFMGGPKARDRERVVVSCLLVLGYIGKPEARTVLLKHARPGLSSYVRMHALMALKSLTFSAAQAAALAKQVSVYVTDPDPDVARQALDVLARLPASGTSITEVRKLLGSEHAAVRSFAVRQLVEIDTAAGNRLLVELLGHEDTDVQETAARALSGHAKAAGLLVDALLAESGEQAAWRLARILKPHSEAVDAAALKKITALLLKDLSSGNARYAALLYVVTNVDALAAEGAMRDAGLKFRRAGEWERAVECLRRLVGTQTFDDQTAYALGVCNLKLSPKELARSLRDQDYALRGFGMLHRRGVFKLLDELKKDKSLDAADLHYVGFHFSESTGSEMDFGADVLAHVAKTWPRSKEGQAAKARLTVVRPQKPKARAAKPKATKPKATTKRKAAPKKR